MSSDHGPGEKPEIVGNRGLFLTERIPPGTYEVHAEGYAPLTPVQERRTGIVGPTLTGQATVTVPESGVVPSLKLSSGSLPDRRSAWAIPIRALAASVRIVTSERRTAGRQCTTSKVCRLSASERFWMCWLHRLTALGMSLSLPAQLSGKFRRTARDGWIDRSNLGSPGVGVVGPPRKC